MIVPIYLILFLYCNFASSELVDLGHDLSEEYPVYPIPLFLEHKFNLTVLVAPEMVDMKNFWFTFNSFCTVEHFGTHIDAPYHFDQTKWTVEQIPIENLVAHAVVINVQKEAALVRNYEISGRDVNKWIEENGPIPDNSVIIANTGWYKRFNNTINYIGHASDVSQFNSPGFGLDAVKTLNAYEEVHGICIVGYGLDTISFDPGNSTAFPAHYIIQAQNKYVVENLNNLDALPAKGATVIVMPMKIRGGTGAPARVVAQLPYNSYVEQKSPRIRSPR